MTAVLFDLGIYPAAIPATDSRVRGEMHHLYNAPLGQAQRIESGDYLEHLKVKR